MSYEMATPHVLLESTTRMALCSFTLDLLRVRDPSVAYSILTEGGNCSVCDVRLAVLRAHSGQSTLGRGWLIPTARLIKMFEVL